MDDFVKALNMYLEYRHIKDTYISLVSEIDLKTIKSILNGDIIPDYKIKEQIATGIGYDVDFFTPLNIKKEINRLKDFEKQREEEYQKRLLEEELHEVKLTTEDIKTLHEMIKIFKTMKNSINKE